MLVGAVFREHHDDVTELGNRVWHALHALPRDIDGEPPAVRPLEEAHELPNGIVMKLARGIRSGVNAKTLTKLAKALEADPAWLLDGTGSPPELTGELPPVPQPGKAPKKRGGGTTRTVELDARYPNLEAAIAYHPKDKWKPATIAAARSWTFKSDVDPPPPEWAALMDEIENRLLGAERRFLEPDEPPPAATPEGLDELDRQMAEEAKARRKARGKKG